MFGISRITLIAAAGLALIAGFLYLRLDTVTLQRDQARAAAAAYNSALSAYRSQYEATTRALKDEKDREIARQENLLKTLNLIGSLDDAKNTLVPDHFAVFLDSLYGPASGDGNTAAP